MSNLELVRAYQGPIYIGFSDYSDYSTENDIAIARYLKLDVEEYKSKFIELGAFNKPHGFKSTFFLDLRDAQKAIEWARTIEDAHRIMERLTNNET